MPAAVITGGAGFIGSALTEALLERGYAVRVYDDLSSGSDANLAGMAHELVRGDVRDLARLTAAAAGADVLFHLAAGAGVVQSIEDPLGNFDVNARGTVTALEAARRAGVGRFVFSSSNAPLGAAAQPASERLPIAPLSPYGASKAVGEAYCSAFHGAYGMDAVAVRFSNAYGPRSAHKGNVIPLFIRSIRDRRELVVYGDGSQTRDFVFVTDLAAGLVLAAEAAGVGGRVFQLASGVETSLNRLVELLGAVCGGAPPVRREPARQGEIERNYSLIDRARDELGYVPEVMLADGLARTWEWFAERG
ncbi:MAG TPA: NAD-dependent epimerase/dehydratase family protein [Gaiellales bacterium]|nr:NAD-dependent epimerase/dehydratase family protein [Gaiellales bacterium]